ncbi:MAG: ATP-dependent helicase HrpB [Planctomycetota bacterium]
MDKLPVHDCLEAVVGALRDERSVILRAPPGAGKTTGVPPAILESDVLHAGRTLLLQPRRMAARAAAHRLASLNGDSVGGTYGYHVRFDRKVSRDTRLVAITTGVLVRQLIADPLLENVACVILDEFHERSLEMDLVLGMLQRIRTTLRPELRLVVMSATLETREVAGLLSDAEVIESEGRAFDVEVRYQPAHSRDRIESLVAKQLPAALRGSDGDVLVFLPGVGEIHRTAEAIRGHADREGLVVEKLYGDLSPQDQDAVLRPSQTRKVVLATNVAETSITIPNVTAVIDSGLARVMRYDAGVGLPSLQLEPISQAAADQRAGRAGRTAPGVCYRLWPQKMHRSRPEQTTPEVLRTDLSSAMLTLAVWGERDAGDFPWVTKPTNHSVDSARQLLLRLGAIDDGGGTTEEGAQMATLPLHPRLAKLMRTASKQACTQEASLAAALLSERDPFDRSTRFEPFRRESAIESDLMDRVLRLRRYLDGDTDEAVHPGGAKNVSRVADRLRQSVESQATERQDAAPAATLDERFACSLLAAYPDRLARRRRPGSENGVMVGGRGVRIAKSSSVRTAELFLCIDLQGRGDEAEVRSASAIDPSWLPSEDLVERRESFFHPSMKAVVARQRTYFHDLMLGEGPCECEPDESTARLLFEHAAPMGESILPKDDKPLHSFLTRWRFVSPDADRLGVLPWTSQVFEELLREFCATRLSIKQLRDAPWLDYLRSCFSYEQLQVLDQQAPESIEVPSGNRIRLEYREGKPPMLAVRIQELYGWTETPRLAGGSVAVQLHLLAPNHRPQQITEDLASFWKTTYFEIRKELKRRYSKHHWPDDPLTAKATKNGLKPK